MIDICRGRIANPRNQSPNRFIRAGIYDSLFRFNILFIRVSRISSRLFKGLRSHSDREPCAVTSSTKADNEARRERVYFLEQSWDKGRELAEDTSGGTLSRIGATEAANTEIDFCISSLGRQLFDSLLLFLPGSVPFVELYSLVSFVNVDVRED